MIDSNIYVTRPLLPDIEEYKAELERIWKNQWISNNGPVHEELKDRLKVLLGGTDIDLLSNGHMAIELAIRALDLPSDGEVITTPFTFISTTEAIVRNGLKPVFCDINENDYTIDVDKIERLITKKTCAILPVHVYGNVCNIEMIDLVAQKYNLKVIYDAAHCVGVRYKGKPIGDYGDVSCFSFHATKVFNTIEGGAVTSTKFPEIIESIGRLKNFGYSATGDEITEIGCNAKLNEFSAAMGICNLRHLHESINKRRIIYQRYKELLTGIKGIRINPDFKDIESNYAYFPIVVDNEDFGTDREELISVMNQKGIYPRRYFYPIVTEFEVFKNAYDNETPCALETSRKILCLPIYHSLGMDEVEDICQIIRDLSVGRSR